MLLPALRGAKESARRVQCMNNMRVIGSCCLVYAEDWDGWLPCWLPTVNTANPTRDIPFVDHPTYFPQFPSSKSVMRELYWCPSQSVDIRPGFPSSYDYFNTYMYYGGYGGWTTNNAPVSAWCCLWYGWNLRFILDVNPNETWRPTPKLSLCKNPSESPLLTELAQEAGVGVHPSIPQGRPSWVGITYPICSINHLTTDGLHAAGENLVYVDGHAEWISEPVKRPARFMTGTGRDWYRW